MDGDDGVGVNDGVDKLDRLGFEVVVELVVRGVVCFVVVVVLKA